MVYKCLNKKKKKIFFREQIIEIHTHMHTNICINIYIVNYISNIRINIYK